jgi:hypothetical protein
MSITLRPKAGTMLFYSRDSGGKHEMTPARYVEEALKIAAVKGLRFNGTTNLIDEMIRTGRFEASDIYLDYDVSGDQLSRPGLNAMITRVATDLNVTDVFIPRRDRLARPDHASEGLELENRIRSLGVTLIYLSRELPPLKRGRRQELGEMLTGMVEYHQSGEDLTKMAQKSLFAQITLARSGYSTGGRPPYGFRRWLVKSSGEKVRELAEGERVRMNGHHVIWLPVDEDHIEMQTIRRILSELPHTRATRLAALFTTEGLPSPDLGRMRKDRDVVHVTSGAWHASTIKNIAENPLLRAIVPFGRRSMGKHLRFGTNGPRELEDSDFRPDSKRKVIRNEAGSQVTAQATFDPLVDLDRHDELLEILKDRGATQRGKPRAWDPTRNPLGGRIFDWACRWPMYRVPKKQAYAYSCGAYMQSHGAQCDHNKIDGPAATNVTLGFIRQKILAPSAFDKLQARLRELAEGEVCKIDDPSELVAKQTHVKRLKAEWDTAKANMARAKTPGQFDAISDEYEKLAQQLAQAQSELEAIERRRQTSTNVDNEVAAAMNALKILPELITQDTDLTTVTEAFDMVNARLFVKFEPVKLTKRTVNRVRFGKLAFGSEEPPFPLYGGPTGRRALKATAATTVVAGAGGDEPLPGPI